MNEAKLTARFKAATSFVVEETTVDFAGSHTKPRITNVKPEIDFTIYKYVEYKDYYDIYVVDTTVGVKDGGYKIIIINVPKSLVTFANKQLNKD